MLGRSISVPPTAVALPDIHSLPVSPSILISPTAVALPDIQRAAIHAFGSPLPAPVWARPWTSPLGPVTPLCQGRLFCQSRLFSGAVMHGDDIPAGERLDDEQVSRQRVALLGTGFELA